MVDKMKFSIGIIGATGYIGTPYRSEIREATNTAEIVALCARRRDRLEAAGRQDGATLITHDWREVVEHPDVNLVLVATPDALHYEPVLACAAAKKHLFCEKPVGKDAGQAYQMWSAYSETELGHFVPFWTRYFQVFRRAREIVLGDTLGEIRAVVYRWHNPRPGSMPHTWRDDASLSSAGSIADVGSHAYDTIRWVTGYDARRVLSHADVTTPLKPDLGSIDLTEALEWGREHSVAESPSQCRATVFDYADIAMEFHNGAVGSLVLSHASFLRKGLAPELELHGTRASLAVDRVTGNITLARPGEDVRVLETVAESARNRFSSVVFPAIHERASGSGCEH
ncbi:MAG: hypothetical protein CMJ62_16175, partial [Planctomycetaceae bacterium]|nr:hypothetical protein [Planctomycetaceae bacterium]